MRKIGLALLCLLLFGACSEDEQVVRREPRRNAAPAPSAATEELKTPNRLDAKTDVYTYNPNGKRDPFEEYMPEVVEESDIPRTPLEKFKLEDLKLVGIIWGIADPRALIKAPDGFSYVVRADTRIGKQRGRVARVTRSKVYVEEEYRDPTGKLLVRETEFGLEKDEKDDSGKVSKNLTFSDN